MSLLNVFFLPSVIAVIVVAPVITWWAIHRWSHHIMSSAEILGIIRDQGGEDWYGLYEITWSLNARYPDVPEAQKIAATIPVLKQLLASGEMVMVKSQWATDRRDPVTREDAIALVGDPSAWASPSQDGRGEYLAYGAA